LFKPVIKPKQDEVQYLVYEPRALNVPVPEQAVPFARSQEADMDRPFKISDLVAEKTKLSDLEKQNFQARVQGEVLSRLKVVEEKAYAEAYSLGLKEGQEKGFNDMTAEIKKQTDQLQEIVDSIVNQKKEITMANEKHLIQTLFHVAKALALDEIKANPEHIKAVVVQALENAQSEEEIILRMNPSDSQFLEKIKGSAGNPFEKMSRLKVEPSESITPGGVIVETNYGIVDATVETRVLKIYQALMSKVPSLTKPKEPL
jgi:flagellar assembly protein FliH